jgi:protein-tyrosine phosphatase
MPVRLCFVCWGNICRSPTAEGIMAKLVADAGLGDQVLVDSAGTSTEELGNPVDPRTAEEARRRGLDLEHTAWQIRAEDLDRFDLLLAADNLVAGRLARLARHERDRSKMVLLRSFSPDFDLATDPWGGEIPDPWYGGPDGFTLVYDLIEVACRGLLDQLRAELDA